jgi:hypothetical protein
MSVPARGRGLAGNGAGSAVHGRGRRGPTTGRQDKGAAVGLAQVVGRLGNFRRCEGGPAGASDRNVCDFKRQSAIPGPKTLRASP